MTNVVHCSKKNYDVYIGRPGFWGNPFEIGKDGNREEVLKKFRHWLLTSDEAEEQREKIKTLRGKTLGCWCKPLPCHGDILAEYADEGLPD